MLTPDSLAIVGDSVQAPDRLVCGRSNLLAARDKIGARDSSLSLHLNHRRNRVLSLPTK